MSAVRRYARTLEELGVPTVAVLSRNTAPYADYDLLYVNGMPIRSVVVPFPVTGVSRSVHKAYVAGRDQRSGRPLMEAILHALTAPLTEEETRSEGEGARPVQTEPRFLPPDTEENLQQLFKDREWTDYLPVILPTEDRVRRMLRGTSHRPEEVIAVLPGGREVTVEKVAIAAVMAGARPEYMPLLLAIATRAPFGNSTSSMANTIIAMGPYNEANAVVGRFFTLISKIAGDLRNNVTAWESLGSNLQYNSLTIAENEEELPEGWEPLHVQMGFRREDSVVTIGIGWSYISSVGEVRPDYPAHRLIADYMSALSGLGSAATLFLDPTVARLLKEANGFATKQDLSTWLSENVEKTVASYWGNGVITNFYMPLALQGLEPYARWSKLPRDARIKPFFNPRAIHVVVVGGGIQTVWFVTDFQLSRGVRVDDWR